MRAAIRTRPIIDGTYLARQTAGDEILAGELLALFREQCRHLLPVIAGGTPRQRCDAAHTLKGGALAVGASRIAALAESVEALDEAVTAPEEGAWLHLALEDAVRDLFELLAQEASDRAALAIRASLR
jgi:HPt (histidine-containing phosphotransfer) domain-containing protein